MPQGTEWLSPRIAQILLFFKCILMYVEVCLLSSVLGVEKILIDYSRTHTLPNVPLQRVGLPIHPLLLCSDEIILSPLTFVWQLGGDPCFYFFIRQALSAMVITNGQTPEILDLACGISQENCTEVVWMRFKGSRMNPFCYAKVIDNHCHDGSRCNLYRPRRLSC